MRTSGRRSAVGFTAVYMQFFNYFLVEKLFGGNRHFGISYERVIKQLTNLPAACAIAAFLLWRGSRSMDRTSATDKHI